MTLRFFLSLLVIITLAACERNTDEKNTPSQTASVNQANHSLPPEELVNGPHYSVKVWLSKNARKIMQDSNETLIISSMFDGDGKAMPEHTKTAFRAVYLGDFKKEIKLEEVAVFDHISFSKTDMLRLSKSYGLLINVTSGRKSSKNNLLSCSSPYYDAGYLQDDAGSTLLTISCDLIGENNNYKPAFITNSKNPTVNIKPNQTIISPLIIELNSQGLWGGFEGEIGTAELLEENNKSLGYTVLSAQDENWMQEGNVRYGGKLTFKAIKSGKGTLRIFNNNPSETEGAHRYFDIPVNISVNNTEPEK